ncbi:hypothetical protein HDE_04039 [Halotydeus destructor]|nr:hypothetical protein HDE_04039 [Halotydeus destructor]
MNSIGQRCELFRFSGRDVLLVAILALSLALGSSKGPPNPRALASGNYTYSQDGWSACRAQPPDYLPCKLGGDTCCYEEYYLECRPSTAKEAEILNQHYSGTWKQGDPACYEMDDKKPPPTWFKEMMAENARIARG